jgi:hypothetical protein
MITRWPDTERLLQFDITLYALRRKHKVALSIKICLYSDSIVRLGLTFLSKELRSLKHKHV